MTMLQIPTNPEVAPRDLAEVLDGLIAAHRTDREISALLATTREQLRALAWNRYAAAVNAASERHVFTRRHKGVRHA
jgi:hypothetical protein